MTGFTLQSEHFIKQIEQLNNLFIGYLFTNMIILIHQFIEKKN